MKRILAIGDIHGGLKALEQLLERAKITPKDQLIFLGDYVDGWSDSAKVISYLIELAKQNSCIFIRGNHDELLHQWLKTHETNEKWLTHGGQSSIDAYRNLSDETIQQHRIFLKEMVNYYIDDENRLFLHAGFTNQHGPEQEYEPYMFYWDRTLWETALCLDKEINEDDFRYPKRLKLFKEIFIGHTPVTRIDKERPVQAANLWNVDTGAAFKGKLSLIDVNSKEVFQSDPVWKLYANEKGRN